MHWVCCGKYSSPLRAVKVGSGTIRKSLQEQLALLQSDVDILGPYPTIIGEIGTPFDIDGKKSHGWMEKGKFKAQRWFKNSPFPNPTLVLSALSYISESPCICRWRSSISMICISQTDGQFSLLGVF
jgi:hypothetical protein